MALYLLELLCNSGQHSPGGHIIKSKIQLILNRKGPLFLVFYRE